MAVALRPGAGWLRPLFADFSRPHRLLGLAILLALVVLVILPVLDIVLASGVVHERDARRLAPAEVGDWTLFYWERTLWSRFSQRIFYGPLVNTLWVTVAFTVLSLVIGTLLGWLVARTDLPMKGLVTTFVVVPYILPSWTLALAWTTLFRTDAQALGAQGVLQQVTGVVVPDWITFGPVPIILVDTLNYYAFAYLLTAAAFARTNRQLEEAAALKGAGLARVLRRISFPLVLPALVSAAVLTFCTGLGSFGVPYFLGQPVNFEVLATYLYANIQLGRYGEAYVLTTILIGIAALSLLLASRMVGLRQSFATLTGKGGGASLYRLGRWRGSVGVAVLVALGLPALLPILMLLLQSTQQSIGNFSLAGFTLDYWIGTNIRGFDGILVDARMQRALINTVVVATSVGLLCALAAFLAGYAVVRGRGTRLAAVIEQVALLPYLIPGVALGAVFLATWAQPPWPLPSLFGTLTLIVLACFVSQLPYAVRAGTSSMMQVAGELEEAARLHSPRWSTVMRRIMLPLTRSGLVVAFVLCFVSTAKELNLVVMLTTARTELLSTTALGFMDIAMEQFAHAIALTLTAVTLLGAALAQRFTGSIGPGR